MTAEKRLLMDLEMHRQSHERREITNNFWISTQQDPADSFTQYKPSPWLDELIKRKRRDLTPNAWIERSTTMWALNRKTENAAVSDLRQTLMVN